MRLSNETWVIYLEYNSQNEIHIENVVSDELLYSNEPGSAKGVIFLFMNCESEITGELEFQGSNLGNRISVEDIDQEERIYFSLSSLQEPLDINPNDQPILLSPSIQGSIAHLIRYNNASSSIEENPSEIDFEIFPNSANESINLKTQMSGGIQFLEILDVNRRSVFGKTYLKNNRLTINSSQWSPGLYVIRLTDENGDYSSKKIVIR